jgi:hypothetical protein
MPESKALPRAACAGAFSAGRHRFVFLNLVRLVAKIVRFQSAGAFMRWLLGNFTE